MNLRQKIETLAASFAATVVAAVTSTPLSELAFDTPTKKPKATRKKRAKPKKTAAPKAAKKNGGRPKGSKNKPKAEAPAAPTPAEAASSAETAP